MTREDVEKLIGRELDAAVHERLFGYADDFPVLGWKSRGLPESYRYTEEGPAFFAMIAAVRKKKRRVDISETVDGGWAVILWDADWMDCVQSVGDTLPLAFARAAVLTTIPESAS